MHRFAIFPLLGPALVFYLIADVSSSQGRLDPYGYVIAAVAIGLSFARRNGAANGESRAVQLVGWLGLSAGVALLRLLSEQTLRLSVDMAEAMALSLLGALLIDLALCVPDPLASLRIRGSILAGVYLCAALSGVLSCVALGPQFHMFGEVWLIPARYVNSSAVFSGLSVFAALGLRAARKRLGSSQEALVANVWGLIGVLPAALLCSLILLGPELLPAQFVRIWAALSALVLYVGHLCLIDTRRRLSVSRATRDGIAACASVVIVATFAGLFSAGIPSDALPRGLWVATSLLFALALYHLLRPSVRRALAPAGGQLLEALSSTQPELGRAHTLEGLVAISLAGVRAASGVTWAKPLMYGFDPGFEAFIDAAGAPHLSTRQPHPMLLARLRERPGDLVLRADLEMQMVRQPSIRPLLEALLEQDVLCVLPLVVESELEGALLLPRGERRAALSVEEQDALWEFARHLAGLLAVFSAKARAEQRANSASLGNSRAQAEIAVLSDVVHSLQADLEVLQVGRSLQAEAATLVAYSAPQRQLLAQLKALAKQSQQHVLCVAEAGVAVEPLARFVHGKAEHAAAPFVMLDCAAVRAEHAEAAIFGGLGPLGPEVGALRVAAAGTLLLLDLAALPLDVQHKLAGALASRKAQLQGSEEAYAVQARVIASVREDVFLLSSQGRFAAELADQLAPGTCRIPPLRECGEDVSSLALLAIDRACRRHGRGPVGIETEALAELRRYAFPGNHWELERIIDGAVTQATGIRLSVADLALSHGPKPNEDVLHATLEEIERRALVHALLRAAGNKSEAARLLAIPRTTLLDKLRRHKLDEAPQETPRAN